MRAFDKPQDKSAPWAPLVGFVLLVIIVGSTYLASPYIMRWLATTTVSMGFFGNILPITMPASWPFLLRRLIVTAIFSLVVFSIVMIPLMLMLRQTTDEMSVTLHDMRKERERKKKLDKKGGRRA